MKIKFIKPSNRSIIVARIRLGDGECFDKSTGIKSDAKYDPATQLFNMYEKGAQEANEKLVKFKNDLEIMFNEFGPDRIDTLTFKKFLAQDQDDTQDLELSVRNILTSYRDLLLQNKVLSLLTDRPLADRTISKNIDEIRHLLKMPTGLLDFNFSIHNASSMSSATTRRKWDDFKIGFMNHHFKTLNFSMESTEGRVQTMKKIIRYMLVQHNVEATSMLKSFKYRAGRREVRVMTREQYDFVLENYNQMRSECESLNERTVLDYWVTSLILCPRKASMKALTRDNIYYVDGKMYVRYTPSKTRSSSGKSVNVPVHPLLVEIFERNIEAYDRPLYELNNNMSWNLKRIAKRYPVFCNRVIVTDSKGGEAKEVQKFFWQTLTLHMGRATGITTMLEKGASEHTVKMVSAHTSDSLAFKRYVNISDQAVADELNKIWA